MLQDKNIYQNNISLQLFGHDDLFNNFIKLYENKNFPKVNLVSGEKGIGKFTLFFHLIIYIFSKEYKQKYNLDSKLIDENNLILNKILSHTFQNYFYFSNEDKNKLSIDKVREVKKKLYSSTLDDKPRFIIFDDVEFINNNVANALLKMIEEPSNNNYFILINNKKGKLIDTLKSRSIETKIFLNFDQKDLILKNLLKNQNFSDSFVFDYLHLTTPAMLLKYYNILTEINADSNTSFFDVTAQLLDKYKKNKQDIYIDCIKFFLEIKFHKKIFSTKNITSLFETKNGILKILYEYQKFNLSNNSVLNFVKNSIN